MTMTVDGVKIGCCLYGSEVGIVDYSRKDRDTFGNVILIERGYSDLVQFKVSMPTPIVAQARLFLASRRARVASYIGHPDHAAVIVSGYLTEIAITLDDFNQSQLTLSVESLAHGTIEGCADNGMWDDNCFWSDIGFWSDI